MRTEEYITSRKNQLFVHLRRLQTSRAYREECRQFCGDGIKLLDEAVRHFPGLHTVIACGAGAISKIVYPGGERIERAPNVSDILHYLGRTEEMIERKKKALEDCRAFSESGEGAFTQELSASKGTEP